MRLVQEVGGRIYSGEATPMPGCPDLVVSHAVYSHEPQGGFGKTANRVRCWQLKNLGYSAVICTVCGENAKQRAIMAKEGWLEVGSFYNARTKNVVFLYLKPLTEVEEEV